MRFFVAAEIPEKIKDRLEKIQANLRRAGVQATWVKREAMHLTLIFLGRIKEEEAKRGGEILKEQLTGEAGLILKLAELGAFLNFDFPRVVWVGLAGEEEKLTSIAERLRKNLKREKIPFDGKPFVPHLTLGRLRQMKPRQRKEVSRTLKQFVLKEKPKLEIKEICLIKSQLTRKGPVYTVEERVSLGKRSSS